MNLNVPVDKNTPEYRQNLVKSARTTLLIAVLFTVLNVVLLLVGSNRYFLYSATIPYYLTFFGYMFDHFTVSTYALTGLSMAAVPVIALALCWCLSKKDHRWLTVAVVVFGLDTAAMVGLMLWSGDLGSSILDIVFHVWVLVSLIQGVKAAGYLKNMTGPETPEIFTGSEEEFSETETGAVDTDCPV